MAFKPVRLTDPKGKLDDVVATHPVDFNNFTSRDGYVVSEDQTKLDSGDAPAPTASTVAGIRTLEQASMKQADIEAAKGESGDAVASDKTASLSGAFKAAPKGKATDAGGNTVQTA